MLEAYAERLAPRSNHIAATHANRQVPAQCTANRRMGATGPEAQRSASSDATCAHWDASAYIAKIPGVTATMFFGAVH